MVPQPEQEAHKNIDRLLTQAGWSVCDANQANIHGARGVAIRRRPELQIALSCRPIWTDCQGNGEMGLATGFRDEEWRGGFR